MDLSAGYWHVELDEESSYLTMFQTCFGRYRYLRLSFGINRSSEYFEKKLLMSLEGLPGVKVVADDVVIHGKTQEDHDANLAVFLRRCQEIGIKLNPDMLDLGTSLLTFMGHKISAERVHPDPEKVAAITKLRAPQDLAELRCFIGMVNYLSKFVPHITAKMHPFHNLLKKDVTWSWSSAKQDAFEGVLQMLSTAPVLAYYNPTKPLLIENDACEYGLGSALIQNGKPVAYASQSLSDAEDRYTQIEKEMLAVSYGLEKFHHYTFGREVEVVTDHKALIAIAAKPLSRAPRRLQNLLLRAQKYDFKFTWKPSNQIPLADALSRAPIDHPCEEETVNSVMIHCMGDDRLQHIRGATAVDLAIEEEGSTTRDPPLLFIPKRTCCT